MKRKILCGLLALALIAGILPLVPVTVRAESNLTTSQELIDLLVSFEGFSGKCVVDGSQRSVGYGTRCDVCDSSAPDYLDPNRLCSAYPDSSNPISKEHALELMRGFLTHFESMINAFADKHVLTLEQKQFDALVSLTYNCGGGWLYEKNNTLQDAVISGDMGNYIVYAFVLYSKSNKVVSPGHVRRRMIEVEVYRNGVYKNATPEGYRYVVFEAGGGTINYPIQGYLTEEDTPIRITIEPTYTQTNSDGSSEVFTFDGWYTAQSGGTKVEVLDGSLPTGATLYARWKASDGTQVVPPSPPTVPVGGVTVTVTATDVNIRKGPGTNYELNGKANRGDTLTITETSQGSGYLWGKFGENQWIALEFTNYDSVQGETAPPATQPPTTAPPTTQTPTTVPPTTVPPTTVPPTTVPPTTVPPTTQPEGPGVMGTVNVGDALNIRSGPGTQYPTVGSYGAGARVEIFEQREVGTKLWGRTDKGWISMDYVILDSAQTPPTTVPPTTEQPTTVPPTTQPPVTQPSYDSWTGTVQVSDVLYIRSGPGTFNAIVGYLANGDKVEILEEALVSGVRWGKTDKGWISLKYVVEGDVPVVTPPTTQPPETTVPTQPEVTEPEVTEPAVPENPSQSGKWTGVVTVKDRLVIRSAPGLSGSIKGNLTDGASVTVSQYHSADGKLWGKTDKGWICLDFVILDGDVSLGEAARPNWLGEETSTVLSAPKTMTVNTCSLRLRSGAGVTNEITGFLPLGEEVILTETWTVGTICWGRTDMGWVNMAYLV